MNKFIYELDKLLIKLNGAEIPKDESEAKWFKRQVELLQKLKKTGGIGFLTQPVIKQTMFMGNKIIANIEYRALKEDRRWEGIWKKIVREDRVGCPERFRLVSSANRVHHTYHLLQLYKKLHITDINRFKYIFEFGGGYGSLCRLFYKLGYQGTYVIVDLPLFTLLQSYYLTKLTLPVVEGPIIKEHVATKDSLSESIYLYSQ